MLELSPRQSDMREFAAFPLWLGSELVRDSTHLHCAGMPSLFSSVRACIRSACMHGDSEARTMNVQGTQTRTFFSSCFVIGIRAFFSIPSL